MSVWWRAAPAQVQAASRRPPLGCSALCRPRLLKDTCVAAASSSRLLLLRSTFRSITNFFSLGASAEELIVCVPSSRLLISN